jgi:hypothetical protein
MHQPELSDFQGLLAFGDVAADEQVERGEIPHRGRKRRFAIVGYAGPRLTP